MWSACGEGRNGTGTSGSKEKSTASSERYYIGVTLKIGAVNVNRRNKAGSVDIYPQHQGPAAA